MLQQNLLNVALFVASQGPTTFEGEKLTCSLNDSQKRTSTLLAMTAGQSVETLLRMAKLRGIPVRDAYPIARSAVESFVNASFLLAESDEVAARALRYVSFASWRHHNRKFGSGEFAIEVQSDPDAAATLARVNRRAHSTNRLAARRYQASGGQKVPVEGVALRS